MFNRTRENQTKRYVNLFNYGNNNNNNEAWYLIVHGITNLKVDGDASKGDDTILINWRLLTVSMSLKTTGLELTNLLSLQQTG